MHGIYRKGHNQGQTYFDNSRSNVLWIIKVKCTMTRIALSCKKLDIEKVDHNEIDYAVTVKVTVNVIITSKFKYHFTHNEIKAFFCQ